MENNLWALFMHMAQIARKWTDKSDLTSFKRQIMKMGPREFFCSRNVQLAVFYVIPKR